MKNTSGRLQEQYEDVSKSILQYMKDISCDEDDVLAADVKKIRESKAVVHADKVLELLETLTNQDADSVKEKEEEFNEDREKSGRAEPENRKGRGSDPCKKGTGKSGADDSREDTNAGRTGNGTEERTGKSAGREQLTEEIGKRQEKLAEYDELKKLQKQIKELEKQIEILKDRKASIRKKAQMQTAAGTEKEFTGRAEGCGN